MSGRSLFLRHVAQTSPFPPMLEVASAEGCYITDIYGKKYLDFISGISVSNVGHRHPAVVSAIREQTEKYMHVMVYGEFIQAPQVQLAEAVCSMLGNPFESVYFVNSGAEAVEGALKLAKRFTGRAELISCENAYHGSTHGALSIMGSEAFKTAYRPLLPGTSRIRFNNFDDLNLISEHVAAVIVEPVQGEAGAVEAKAEWLESLRSVCSHKGVLLIFDEIQTGFGRTGTAFAWQQYGVVPDVVLMAKGMGGGLPIGAFAASRDVMQCLSHDPLLGHITTFGGNAVCAAAALAVAREISKPELLNSVEQRSKLIRELLKHPDIIEIRGKGLLLAMKLESNQRVLSVMNKCYELGLITDWFLFADDCIRIAPPIIISEEETREACAIVLKALEQTATK
ncbi:MAG: aspartate aminotransferase family protein [Bacteroidetes bacterium]|nr:aspartate aminotransferase family protein [Bacteroidota bacterium]